MFSFILMFLASGGQVSAPAIATDVTKQAKRAVETQRIAKVERIIGAVRRKDNAALAQEGVVGVPYWFGFHDRIPMSFAIDTLTFAPTCAPTKPRWTSADSYSVVWNCPDRALLPWSSTGTYFKFDGLKISEIRTTPGPPLEARISSAPAISSDKRSGPHTSPARPRANLTSYFSDADYPASALRLKEEGVVRVKLEVGPNGRIVNCATSSSSGSTSLDVATCRILRARARFTPARDANGNPISATVAQSIPWKLPR